MFVANTGSLAMHYNEEGINTHGSLTKSIRRPNEMTSGRLRAVATIVGMADTKSQPIGVVVGKVLLQAIPELQSFVQARGEAPASDPVKLALQAALIRATEIGMVAKTLDTDDDDAYMIIEDSEQQHVDDNTGDSTSVLSPGTAAGIALLVGRLSDTFKKLGGSGSLSDFTNAVKKKANVDSFDKVNYGGLANNLTDDEIQQYYAGVLNGSVPAPASTPSSSSSGGSFWDNLFNHMDTIVNGVMSGTAIYDKVAGTNVSGTILDNVNQIGGGIGASTAEQYLSRNWWKVALFVLAFIIITILLLRASRK